VQTAISKKKFLGVEKQDSILKLPPATGSKHIGRPKGSKNKKTLLQTGRVGKGSAPAALAEAVAEAAMDSTFNVGKAKKTFDKMIADAVLAQHEIAEPGFDGGGTAESGHVVTKESLERRVARRLNVLDRYLTDDRLLSLLAMSGLKEVGIYEGIMMDKALVLKGQPTVIIGSEDRSRIDEVLPRLMSELKRRKMITSVSERKIEFTSPGGDSGDSA
jgi:hypothetical protein